MMLSNQQKNVLQAIVEMTTFRNGPRKGQVKKRIENLSDSYDCRTLWSLVCRGLIDHKDASTGSGWAATPVGVAASK